MNTLLWYDYETWGRSPKYHRIAQFAAVRTDEDLNLVEEPVTAYCRPTDDFLPDPVACLITGLTPQVVSEKGLAEKDFIALIHQTMSFPATCTVGYNNIRFDDEFTRYTLYRNFYDPYEREWQAGNSRWDIIDMVRMAYALRPDTLSWPQKETGDVSFKLEDLVKENQIEQTQAHDALSDVLATIGLAKKIKQHSPKLYDFCFHSKSKAVIAKRLDLNNPQPLLHISSKYAKTQKCAALVIPLAQHLINKNEIIVYDLSHSPDALIEEEVENLRYRIFTAKEDLKFVEDRLPIKTIHINRCPILVPTKLLNQQDYERLNIDLEACKENALKIKQHTEIISKIQSVFDKTYEPEGDVDYGLYASGFWSQGEKKLLAKLRMAEPAEFKSLNALVSHHLKIKEMWFRYRARNYPDTLTQDETNCWKLFCAERLNAENYPDVITVKNFFALLESLKTQYGHLTKETQLFFELETYVHSLMKRISGF